MICLIMQFVFTPPDNNQLPDQNLYQVTYHHDHHYMVLLDLYDWRIIRRTTIIVLLQELTPYTWTLLG